MLDKDEFIELKAAAFGIDDIALTRLATFCKEAPCSLEEVAS